MSWVGPTLLLRTLVTLHEILRKEGYTAIWRNSAGEKRRVTTAAGVVGQHESRPDRWLYNMRSVSSRQGRLTTG